MKDPQWRHNQQFPGKRFLALPGPADQAARRPAAASMVDS
jgi:hypothetical protein